MAHLEGRRRRDASSSAGTAFVAGADDLVQPVGRPGDGAGAPRGEIGQVGQHITRSNLSIQPTITVRLGFSVNVIVTKDMMVPPYPDLLPPPWGLPMSDVASLSSPGDERPRRSKGLPRPCGACRRVCLRPCLPARVAPSLELDAQPAARALLGSRSRVRPRGIARRVPGARQREDARPGAAVPRRPGALLVKPIVAVKDDDVCTSGGTLSVNGAPRARSPSPIPAAGRCRTTSDAAPFQEASSSWRRICRRALTCARSACALSELRGTVTPLWTY